MNLKFLFSLLLTLAPFIELRGGLPIAIIYSQETGFPIAISFSIIVILNTLLIFLIFFFLDYLHRFFLKIDLYSRFFENQVSRIRKKSKKIEDSYGKIGFWAMVLFISVPLPGTGVYSGSLITWMLGLNRKKMILAMALGNFIAGTLVFLATKGIIFFF